MRILIVEDEEELADAVSEALRDEAYAVDLAADGPAAEELMAVNTYDLAVLDWSIPPPTGRDLLARWRAAGRQLPIIMLTGRRAVADRVDGLDAGADDYLTKPFALTELLARVRTLLRRKEKPMATLRVADLELDRSARRVTVGGREVALTPKELAILEYLLTRKGETVSRSEISDHVWDDSFDAMSNVVDVTVYRLRKKVDGKGARRFIHTAKGAGYVVREPVGE